MLRHGGTDRAAEFCDAVVEDSSPLVAAIPQDAPVDEDRIALEHLLAAIDLIVSVRGADEGLAQLRGRTSEVLGRS